MADYISPVFNTGEEVDEALTAGLQSKAAVVELVDGGAKNHAKVNNFTATLHQLVDVEPIGGTIHLHIGEYTSTDTDTTNYQITFGYSDGTTSGKILTKGAIDTEFNLANYTLTRIDIYASDNWNHSSGDDVTVSEIMVCSKAAWDISQAYQPYRPSYQDLYEMVQALQPVSLSMASPTADEPAPIVEEGSEER
jgi:hypothetical protein